MSYITTDDGTQIVYKHWGLGEPVLFGHGWPLNSDSREHEMLLLAANGYRCSTRGHRGHGRSTQTWNSGEMDTIARSPTCTYVSMQPRGA